MFRRSGLIILAASLLAATILVTAPTAQGAVGTFGRLKGRVMLDTQPTRTPCPQPRIIVYVDGGIMFADGSSDGTYVVENVPTGSHMVVHQCLSGDWVQETFRDLPGFDFANYEGVNILDGVTSSQINALLEPGGSISGTILRGNHTPVPSCGSVPFPVDRKSGNFLTSAPCPDANGAYTIHGVPSGKVFVRFVSPSGTWVERWWKNADDIATAKGVAVDLGANTSGIDAVVTRSTVVSARVASEPGATSITLPDGMVIPAG